MIAQANTGLGLADVKAHGPGTGIRLATGSKDVRVMTDVACFCGCLYSFDGGAGGCPRCGEYATVSTRSAFTRTERGQQHAQAVPATGRNGQNRHTVGSFPADGREPVAGLSAGISAIARSCGRHRQAFHTGPADAL